jgi:hypothetical protein
VFIVWKTVKKNHKEKGKVDIFCNKRTKNIDRKIGTLVKKKLTFGLHGMQNGSSNMLLSR